MAQPGICAYIFLCKCRPCPACSQVLKFDAALAELEQAWGPTLGATAMCKRGYGYEVWIPYQPPTEGVDGRPGQPERPAHWEKRELIYLRIEFPPRPRVRDEQPPRFMQQPGVVTHNPMMMQQQQQQQQQWLPPLPPQGEPGPAWSREPPAWSPPQEQRPEEHALRASLARLLPGRMVRIRDLLQDAALNGTVGTILKEPGEDGWVVVQLADGLQRSFSVANVKLVKPRAAS